jgi:hypothetical protein
MSRPLVSDVGNLGAADIALMEIIEDKIGYEMPDMVELGSSDRQRNASVISLGSLKVHNR